MTALLVFLYDLPVVAHWYLLGVAVAAGATLTLWELRAVSPFLDVRLLAANRALTRTYPRFGLAMLCVYIVLYGFTQWTEAVRGLSESESGLLLLPMTLVSAVVISPVSRRNLVRGPLIAAALMCVAGSAGVLLLTSSTRIGLVVAVTVFHTHVTDHGLHQFTWIMVGTSVALVISTVADRSLYPRPRR